MLGLSLRKAGAFLLAFGLFSWSATAAETGTFASGAPAHFVIERGNIFLKMVPNNDPLGTSYFLFLDKDGQQQWLQTFSGSKRGCSYLPGVSPLRVALSASGGSVGYLEGSNGFGLGVAGIKDGAGGCTQVNQGEELTLDFRGGLGANQFIDYAELDMELKYSDTIFSISLFKDADLVYTYTRTCTLADCGPDSTNSDNRRVRVPISPDRVFFNRMLIKAVSTGQQASATLEGGSDFYAATGQFNLNTQASKFHVASPAQPLVCGQEIDVINGQTSATVTFLAPPGGCPTDKSYSIELGTDTNGNEILEVLQGGSTTEIFSKVVTRWAPLPAENPLGPNLYSVVTPPIPEENEVWCSAPLPDLIPMMPLGRYWCLMEKNVLPLGIDFMQITETHLLRGDATVSFKGGGGSQ